MAGIVGFSVKFFSNPKDLAAFVAASVTTLYSIVYDNSGQYVLFYK